MVLWSRAINRRQPFLFTIELRRYFAAKIIQNWWLNIMKTRKTTNDTLEKVFR